MRTYIYKYFEQCSKTFQLFTKLTLIAIILIFLAILGYFIWALDRGFDISDESYYLLLAIHPSEVKIFVSAQHWTNSLLWSCTGTLVSFRAIGLCILLFSASVLTSGVINTFSFFSLNKLSGMDKIFILVFSLSGALLYGVTINFSPCYNLLASTGSYFAIGLVLLSLNRVSNYQTNVLYFFSGCAIGIIFINKESAAPIVFCLTALAIAMDQRLITKKISGIAFVVLGFVSFVFIMALPYLSKSNIFDDIKLCFIYMKLEQEESFSELVLRSVREFIIQQFWSGMFLIIPVALLTIYSKSRYKIHYIFGVMLCVVLLHFINLHSSFLVKGLHGTTSRLSAILAISMIFTISSWTKNSKSLIVATILFILPYAVSVGSGNNLSTQIVVSLAPWAALIAILATSAKLKIEQRFFLYLLGTLFILTIIGQVIYSSFKPYQLNGSIWEQSNPVKIGQIGFVKTDKMTAEFILKLDTISKNCKISSNRLYLGLYRMPGVPIVIQVTPYFSPWLTNSEQAEIILNKADSNSFKDIVLGIRLNHDGLFPKLPKQLSDFPKGYTMCGQATYPYKKQVIQIWQTDRLIKE